MHSVFFQAVIKKNILGNRSKMLNPESDAYWKSRGLNSRPNNWKDLVASEKKVVTFVTVVVPLGEVIAKASESLINYRSCLQETVEIFLN